MYATYVAGDALNLCQVDKYTKPSSSWSWSRWCWSSSWDAILLVLIMMKNEVEKRIRQEKEYLFVSISAAVAPSSFSENKKANPFYRLFFFSFQRTRKNGPFLRSSKSTHTRHSGYSLWLIRWKIAMLHVEQHLYSFNQVYYVICGRVDQKSQFSG